jgi:hypothetical protein
LDLQYTLRQIGVAEKRFQERSNLHARSSGSADSAPLKRKNFNLTQNDTVLFQVPGASPAVKPGTKLQPNRSSSQVDFRGRYHVRRTLTNTALMGKSQFSMGSLTTILMMQGLQQLKKYTKCNVL